MIKIGFTGTQRGMTLFQYEVLKNFLSTYVGPGFDKELWLLHGDCIGADDQASRLAKSLGFKIWIYPPISNSKRAFCNFNMSENPQDYLVRNHDMVNNCDMLVATPGENYEMKRSGTWATIRYAKNKLDKHTFIIYPEHI